MGADGDTNELGGPEAEPTPDERPALTPVPGQQEVVDPDGGVAGCDRSYPDLCVPPPPPDLDCGYVDDQGFRHITVLPPDPRRTSTATTMAWPVKVVSWAYLVDHFVHEVEGQRAAVRSDIDDLPRRHRSAQPVEALRIGLGVADDEAFANQYTIRPS